MPASSTGDPQFHTTHWSLIAAATGDGGEQAQAALEEVCRAYWYPVYAFIRRRGQPAEDAGDLTQAFFATLLEKEYLADADRERGRFRAFLLTAVARFVAKERDKAAAQKRGGGQAGGRTDFIRGQEALKFRLGVTALAGDGQEAFATQGSEPRVPGCQ